MDITHIGMQRFSFDSWMNHVFVANRRLFKTRKQMFIWIDVKSLNYVKVISKKNNKKKTGILFFYVMSSERLRWTAS